MVLTTQTLFFSKNLIISVLGLHCCTDFSPAGASKLLTVVTSRVEHGLQVPRLR